MIVLDTHAWLWWVSAPASLGRAARKELDRARHIGVPAICCLEVSMLVAKERIRLDRPTLKWMEDALLEPGIDLLPLTPAVAAKAVDLGPDFPGDPADRLIAATAIVQSATLVTKDARIAASRVVRTIW
ncbi:MAG: type II toxin-antitoxin system VapC family toxin [Acidobacteriota bacterium]